MNRILLQWNCDTPGLCGPLHRPPGTKLRQAVGAGGFPWGFGQLLRYGEERPGEQKGGGVISTRSALRSRRERVKCEVASSWRVKPDPAQQ